MGRVYEYELIKNGEEICIGMEDAQKKQMGFLSLVEGGVIITPKDLEAGMKRSTHHETSSIDNLSAATATVNPSDPPEVVTAGAANAAKRRERLVSLDVFRGITVALMILVDDVGGLFPAISHSPWDGVTLADFVMPFFLFIVGVALPLAYKRVPNKVSATKKAILRATRLFILGLILQGGYFHGLHDLTYGVDMQNMRLMGVLQRIAIAYLFVAVCEIWLKCDNEVDSGTSLLRRYRYQLFAGSFLTIIYIFLMYGLYVPDWDYQLPEADNSSHLLSELCMAIFLHQVKCGVRGDTGPACNAVGMVDRKILGIQHLYRRPVYKRTTRCSIKSPDNGPLPHDAPSWCQAPFEPEGLLSSIMAIVTCLIGLQFGHVIIHFKDHKDRIIKWMIPSFCLLASAFALDFFGMRMIKALYTLSYTLATAGAAGLLFAGIYVLVDLYGCRRATYAMEWMGVHALSIYILIACNILPFFIQGFYWREPSNNLLKIIGIGS